MMPGSFHGTRTIGVTGWPCIAWKHCIIDWYSCTPCCMSTVALSKPHCAITSAEKPDGIASHAFTTALPEAHTFLTLLVVIDRFPFVIVAISWSSRSLLAGGPLDAGLADADFAGSVDNRRPGIVRQWHAV